MTDFTIHCDKEPMDTLELGNTYLKEIVLQLWLPSTEEDPRDTRDDLMFIISKEDALALASKLIELAVLET